MILVLENIGNCYKNKSSSPEIKELILLVLKVNFRQIFKNFYIFLMNWRYGGMNFRFHFDQIIPAAKFRITFTLKCVSSLRTHIHKLYAQS